MPGGVSRHQSALVRSLTVASAHALDEGGRSGDLRILRWVRPGTVAGPDARRRLAVSPLDPAWQPPAAAAQPAPPAFLPATPPMPAGYDAAVPDAAVAPWPARTRRPSPDGAGSASAPAPVAPAAAAAPSPPPVAPPPVARARRRRPAPVAPAPAVTGRRRPRRPPRPPGRSGRLRPHRVGGAGRLVALPPLPPASGSPQSEAFEGAYSRSTTEEGAHADDVDLHELLRDGPGPRRLRPAPDQRLAPAAAHQRAPEPARGVPRADAAGDPARHVRRDHPAAAGEVRGGPRARLRLLGARQGPLPRQHVPPARLGRCGLPPHPVRDQEARGPRRAARHRQLRDAAARLRPRHRAHRLRQVDDAGLARRPGQPQPRATTS